MASFYTVFKKELQDHFNSWQVIFAFLVILLPSIYYIWLAAGKLKAIVSSSSYFAFIPLYTASISDMSFLPTSFLGLIGFILPVIGIALGMDAINSEKNNGTLSRLISQPIYRDNIINAKFLAGVGVIAVLMTATVLLTTGMAINLIGIPPTAEEAWRLLFFLIISIIYGAFWLGLAILMSTLFKQVAVSAIVCIAIWLAFALFFPLVLSMMLNSIDPNATLEATTQQIQTYINISRISPVQLFQESMSMILAPESRTISQMLTLVSGDAINFAISTPLSLSQSLLSVWPQIMITILLTIICFAISYVKFMREEIRPN
jgi:ABC-2 type transport system permease protein